MTEIEYKLRELLGEVPDLFGRYINGKDDRVDEWMKRAGLWKEIDVEFGCYYWWKKVSESEYRVVYIGMSMERKVLVGFMSGVECYIDELNGLDYSWKKIEKPQ